MVIVHTGDTGVDFSFARPPAQRLVELGYKFVVGYISVPPAAPAKNITATECQAYLAAGLKVLLVWEMNASRASLGGVYGNRDGADAKIRAAALGYPTDCPILFADDTNTTAANIDKHEEYMRAAADSCHPYPMGIYGDIDILGRCAGLWEIGWLPNAWSWSGTSRKDAEAKARVVGAHVLQHTGFYIDNVWAVDPNEAIADFPAWGLTVDPPTPHPPSEDDMQVATFEVEGLPGIYMWAPGMPEPVPFTNPTDFNNLATSLGSAGNGTKISKDMYDRLFVKPTPVEVTVPPAVINLTGSVGPT